MQVVRDCDSDRVFHVQRKLAPLGRKLHRDAQAIGTTKIMPKQGSESPESRQLAERENSACSVDTVESFSGKEGKSRDKGKHKGGDLNKLFSLPESEVNLSTCDLDWWQCPC